MRVLVVEDERQLCDAIARGLRREGIAVDVATNGALALEKVKLNEYEVVVLDRNLPVVHGDVVCAQLRTEENPARILMLTASGTTEDLVEGLGLGADDYLLKPFAFAELVARIRTLGRRSPAPPAVLERGDLRVDSGRREATRAGQPVLLTPKEFSLLEELLRADGNVVSAEALLDHVWDEHTDPFTNVVRVTVMTLRRKLGDPPLIETVTGAGYRIR